MSAVSRLLTDFAERRETSEDLRFLTAEELEDERLNAFEKGYTEGWEDALQSVETGKTALSETFRQRIEDLSFTYHEAHSAMQRETAALLQTIFETVLPSAARQVLVGHAMENLAALVRDASKLPIEIVVHPSHATALGTFIQKDPDISIAIRGDHTLTETQAELQFSENGLIIDTGAVSREILETLAAFSHEARNSETKEWMTNVTE